MDRPEGPPGWVEGWLNCDMPWVGKADIAKCVDDVLMAES